MKSEFKLMVFCNAVLVMFYLLWNWAEDSAFSTIYNARISSDFPLYIQVGGSTQNGFGLIQFYDLNFGFLILLFAILVNLTLAYRLQGNKETKQTPS